ncbi:hypothetical protein IJE86_02290 [bacterium]|nr:hypothetical protein [bacterium]
MYQERLAELQSLSEVKSCVLTGMPVSKSVSDKIGYSVIKIINTKNTLTKLCEEITEYIENVDDPIIRMILTYRYINNFSWEKTAFKIGGGNRASGLKKRLYRYFRKENKTRP